MSTEIQLLKRLEELVRQYMVDDGSDDHWLVREGMYKVLQELDIVRKLGRIRRQYPYPCKNVLDNQ